MNIRIKATNVTLTDSLNDYVTKCLAKITKTVGSDPAILCDVELARTTEHHNKGDIFRAELHLVGSHLDEYVSVDREDMNAAVTGARDEMLSILRSGKVKRVSYVRRSGARMKAMLKGIVPWGEHGWYRRGS